MALGAHTENSIEDLVPDRLLVRVNDELVLDAGTCEEVSGPHGPERLIRPPRTTLFHQVVGYLRAKPDPAKRCCVAILSAREQRSRCTIPGTGGAGSGGVADPGGEAEQTLFASASHVR
jgi:hypothetical protein